MIQTLADQHHLSARIDQSSKFFHACSFQLRLQLVLEIFLAQQIEAVAADATQYGVNHSRREHPVRSVQKRTQQSHD